MAIPVMMPKQGQSVESCIISQWFKKKGDRVSVGEPLFSYETDKASFEEEAKIDGILLEVFYGEGEEVPVLKTVAVIGQAGEAIDEFLPAKRQKRKSKTSSVEVVADVVPEENVPKRRGRRPRIKPEPAPVIVTKVRVAPPVRVLAKQLGVDLHSIDGTGANGSITSQDVEKAAAAGKTTLSPAPVASATVSTDEPPVVKIRVAPPVRALAKKLGVELTSVTGTGANGNITAQDIERTAGIISPAAKPALPATATATASVAPAVKIRVAPPVRALAKKLGVELTSVTGTGAKGNITAQDIERAAEKTAPPADKPRKPGRPPKQALPATDATAPAPAPVTVEEPAVKLRVSPPVRAIAKKLGVDITTVVGTGRKGNVTAQDVEKAAGKTLASVSEQKMRISPRAVALAEEKGVNLSTVKGTGPAGRIVTRDIEAAAAAITAPVATVEPATPAATVEPAATKTPKTPKTPKAPKTPKTPATQVTFETSVVPVMPRYSKADSEVKQLSNVRQIIANSMYQSLQNSAQLTHHMSADVRKLLALRQEVKFAIKADPTYPNITINDMICWAVVRALEKFPEVNSQYLGDTIKTFKNVHLGLAVDTPRGLMVPVLQNADDLTLKGMSNKLYALAEGCRKGGISPELLKGDAGSFTVSNLGSYGVEMFTPIINVPQVAILGVNAIVQRPVDIGGGTIAFVPHVGLSLTYDHRAIDGGPASLFLKEIKTQIENLEYNA